MSPEYTTVRPARGSPTRSAGADRAPIVQHDRLTLVQPAPQRALRYAELPRPLGVEPPQTRVLHQRVADRVGPVLGLEHDDVVLAPDQPLARTAAPRSPPGTCSARCRARWPCPSTRCAPRGPYSDHRRGPILQSHGPEQAGDAEDVIRVIVGEEDLREGEPHPVPHHLPLVPLPAVEEDRLAFALKRETGDVAVDGRRRRTGAEKGEGKHGLKREG